MTRALTTYLSNIIYHHTNHEFVEYDFCQIYHCLLPPPPPKRLSPPRPLARPPLGRRCFFTAVEGGSLRTERASGSSGVKRAERECGVDPADQSEPSARKSEPFELAEYGAALDPEAERGAPPPPPRWIASGVHRRVVCARGVASIPLPPASRLAADESRSSPHDGERARAHGA